MAIKVSPKIRSKLAHKKPPVSLDEIEQCFADRDRTFLEDSREPHRTIPPTQWFIASTDMGRLLKVVFVKLENGDIAIKTAYDPNADEKKLYAEKSVPL